MTDKFNTWITPRKMICLLSVSAAAWFLFTAILTVLRYRANLTSTYDFGIFSQMYYYMDKTLEPLTTCERDGLISHFAVHIVLDMRKDMDSFAKESFRRYIGKGYHVLGEVEDYVIVLAKH